MRRLFFLTAMLFLLAPSVYANWFHLFMPTGFVILLYPPMEKKLFFPAKAISGRFLLRAEEQCS